MAVDLEAMLVPELKKIARQKRKGLRLKIGARQYFDKVAFEYGEEVVRIREIRTNHPTGRNFELKAIPRNGSNNTYPTVKDLQGIFYPAIPASPRFERAIWRVLEAYKSYHIDFAVPIESLEGLNFNVKPRREGYLAARINRICNMRTKTTLEPLTDGIGSFSKFTRADYLVYLKWTDELEKFNKRDYFITQL